MRPDLAASARDERRAVEQVGVDDGDPIAHTLERGMVVDRSPHDADDVVAVLEEQLGQVRTVLAADAGDQSTPRGHPSMIRSVPACGTLPVRCRR